MRTFRRIQHALVAISVLPLLSVCGDSSGPESIAGTYTLQTMNGRGAPFWSFYGPPEYREVSGQGFVVEAFYDGVSEILRLDPDGTATLSMGTAVKEIWYDAVTLAEVSSNVDTTYDSVSCTFSVTGSAVSLAFDVGGAIWEGSVSGRFLTFVTEDVTRVYER